MTDRVLVISPEVVFPTNAGGRAAVLAQCTALREAGFAVDLVVFHRHEVGTAAAAEHTSIADHVMFVRRRSLIAASIVSPLQPYQLSGRWLSGGTVRSIESRLDRPALIVAQQEWTLLAAARLWRANPVPVLLSSHNDESAYYTDQLGAARGPRRAYLAGERVRLDSALRRVLRIPSGVVTLSAQDQQAYAGVPARTIPHPLPDRAGARRDPSLGACEVLYVGALDMPHAVEGLLWYVRTVWPEVLRRVPQATFIIAGRRAPAALRAELEASRGVRFLGEVLDVAPLYEHAAVFVNPVFLGSGINIKLAEPVGRGIPSVTTTIGARGYEALDDALVIADDPAEFADRCVALLTDAAAAHETSDRLLDRGDGMRMPAVAQRWREAVAAEL